MRYARLRHRQGRAPAGSMAVRSLFHYVTDRTPAGDWRRTGWPSGSRNIALGQRVPGSNLGPPPPGGEPLVAAGESPGSGLAKICEEVGVAKGDRDAGMAREPDSRAGRGRRQPERCSTGPRKQRMGSGLRGRRRETGGGDASHGVSLRGGCDRVGHGRTSEEPQPSGWPAPSPSPAGGPMPVTLPRAGRAGRANPDRSARATRPARRGSRSRRRLPRRQPLP